MCNYCSRHKDVEHLDGYEVACNEIMLASAPYTKLTLGVDEDDNIVMVAYGDYEAVYKPKYCPECGKSLGKLIPTMDGRWIRE